MTAPVTERLSDSNNVLMLSSPMSWERDDVHRDLLTNHRLDRANLLILTFGRADRLVRQLRDEDDDLNDVVVLQLSEGVRHPASRSGDVEIRTISPTDLTGLGMTISDVVKGWAGDDARTVVCFDSITDFLQYADRSTTYRFLRVVTRRFEAVDGFAHFHMNPDAHDSQTVATLTSPFDAVVDTSDETDVRVSTKY